MQSNLNIDGSALAQSPKHFQPFEDPNTAGTLVSTRIVCVQVQEFWSLLEDFLEKPPAVKDAVRKKALTELRTLMRKVPRAFLMSFRRN